LLLENGQTITALARVAVVLFRFLLLTLALPWSDSSLYSGVKRPSSKWLCQSVASPWKYWMTNNLKAQRGWASHGGMRL
jgi:hypothetical protein